MSLTPASSSRTRRPWLHAKLAVTAVRFAHAFVRYPMEKPCGIDGSVAGEPRLLAVRRAMQGNFLQSAQGLIIAHLFVLQLAVVLQLVVINGLIYCLAQEGDTTENERGNTCGAWTVNAYCKYSECMYKLNIKKARRQRCGQGHKTGWCGLVP